MTVEKAIEILSDVGDINRCCAEDAEALDMAIKALEQTSYKSEARRWKRRYLDLKHRIFKLEGQQPKWISVSERLPEVGREVLACFDFKGNRSVYISHFYSDGEFHGLDDEYLTSDGRKYRKAVAWMPLPEPYKAESEDKE